MTETTSVNLDIGSVFNQLYFSLTSPLAGPGVNMKAAPLTVLVQGLHRNIRGSNEFLKLMIRPAPFTISTRWGKANVKTLDTTRETPLVPKRNLALQIGEIEGHTNDRIEFRMGYNVSARAMLTYIAGSGLFALRQYVNVNHGPRRSDGQLPFTTGLGAVALSVSADVFMQAEIEESLRGYIVDSFRDGTVTPITVKCISDHLSDEFDMPSAEYLLEANNALLWREFVARNFSHNLCFLANGQLDSLAPPMSVAYRPARHSELFGKANDVPQIEIVHNLPVASDGKQAQPARILMSLAQAAAYMRQDTLPIQWQQQSET